MTTRINHTQPAIREEVAACNQEFSRLNDAAISISRALESLRPIVFVT
jgi:hypothetical protein